MNTRPTMSEGLNSVIHALVVQIAIDLNTNEVISDDNIPFIVNIAVATTNLR